MTGISVIIPVHNREQYLGEAIQSVLAQGYSGPVEIVVSDDGSTDRSLEIAESFGDAVRVLRRPNGCDTRGAAGTRNRGIAAATHAYVAFLDSDDFYLPGHLARMADVLERTPELGFVVSRMLKMKETGGRRVFAPWTKAQVSPHDVSYLLISGGALAHTNAFLFRRRVFEVVGVFNEAYPNHEDGDLWMRVSEQFQGAFSDHYGAVYRVEHGAGQLTDASNIARNLDCLARVVSSALARCQAANAVDGYRLFRLRLMAASFGAPRWYALVALGIRHPIRTLSTLLSLDRLRRRRERSSWTESLATAMSLGVGAGAPGGPRGQA